MTYRQMLKIALEQSAIDSSCSAEDFLKGENTVVKSVKNERARRYLKLPFILDLTSYGSGIVASVGEGYEEIATDYITVSPNTTALKPRICTSCPRLFARRGQTCALWRSIGWQSPKGLEWRNANTEQKSSRHPTSPPFTPPSGATRYAPSDVTSTVSASAHTTATDSSPFAVQVPTARICGKSASTSCPNTVTAVLPRRLPHPLPLK